MGGGAAPLQGFGLGNLRDEVPKVRGKFRRRSRQRPLGDHPVQQAAEDLHQARRLQGERGVHDEARGILGPSVSSYRFHGRLRHRLHRSYEQRIM